MSTGFQEFLRRKTEGTDWRQRNLRRSEWLQALGSLYDDIRGWLRESDPDGLLEVIPYEVQRVEQLLGVYDAPAMAIRLGTDSADVRPVGRYAIGTIDFRTFEAIRDLVGPGAEAGGRVDLTDGDRRYILLRMLGDQPSRWIVVDPRSDVTPFDRGRLEGILKDLWA